MEDRTILGMLDKAALQWPGNPYLLKKKDQGYVPTSFEQAADIAKSLAAWLVYRGFRPGQNFAILGDGSPEWVCFEFGLLTAGLVSVPLSNRLTETEIVFRLNHSEAKGLAVSHNYLQTALEATARVFAEAVLHKDYTFVILYLDDDFEWAKEHFDAKVVTARGARLNIELLWYQDALAKGNEILQPHLYPNADPAARIKAQKNLKIQQKLEMIRASIQENTVATISYTSGTMGQAKGIMLTHLNYWSNCHDSNALFDNPMYFRMLLMLPPDHAFTHSVAIFTALTCSVALYFVDTRGGNMATFRNLPKNMQEAQPMLLFTVPALSANFMKKIYQAVQAKGPLINGIFNAGIRAGILWNGDCYHKPNFLVRLRAFAPYFFAKAFVFESVKSQAFGKAIRFCVSGGAKLDIKQQQFFMALGVPVYQGYGLTEAAPVVASNTPKRHKLGTVGIAAPSVRYFVVDEKGNEVQQGNIGEIAVKGENVMAGYYKDPEETAHVLKGKRLMTGDLGYVDEDGFLVVTGRKRALLIGADGEKYSPEIIEEAVISSTEVFDQVMVWCVYRKYSCALVSLNMDAMTQLVHRIKPQSAKEICIFLQNEFYRFKNQNTFSGLNPSWIPVVFQIVTEPFSEYNGTINSSLKLVRHRVEELYADLIEYSYSKEGSSNVNPRNIAAIRTFFELD